MHDISQTFCTCIKERKKLGDGTELPPASGTLFEHRYSMYNRGIHYELINSYDDTMPDGCHFSKDLINNLEKYWHKAHKRT